MKNNKIGLLAVGLVFLLVNIAGAATSLMEIGRSPFHIPPLTSVADLQSMIQDKQKEINKAFIMAGHGDLFEPFMEQAPQAEVEKVDFQQGSQFAWMIFKKKGKGPVRVARDVTWANEKSFPGFRFHIDKDGDRYTFAVPLGCGNIALMDKNRVPIVPPNQSPQCTMTVSPVKAYCGETITIDARASSDSDGDISKMSLGFIDAQGQVVSEQVVEGNALLAEVALPCGNNTLKVTLIDNEGLEVTSPECSVAVTGDKRVRFLADFGYYRQFDPGDYLFGRVGMEYKINEDFSVLGLVGGAQHFKGADGASAFMVDVLGEYSFSRYFIDLGVGGWISDGDNDIDAEDTQLDLIAAFGARVYGEPESINTSVFVEVRTAVDEIDDVVDYGRFGVGVRVRF